jgi:mRNA interferase MazF
VLPRCLLLRGEIWQADLNSTVDHEQVGQRPVIIMSTNRFNQGGARLVVVVPLTRTDRGNPLHVPIVPAEGGLRHRSVAMCDMVRSISLDRLLFPIGRINRSAMDEINDRLRIMLDL